MRRQNSSLWYILIIFTLTIIIMLFLVYILDGLKADKGEKDEPNESAKIESENASETGKDIDYESGLFSWEVDTKHPRNRTSLYVLLDYLSIDEVYQNFTGVEADDTHALDLARELDLMDIDLYVLSGNSNWTYEAQGKPMLDEIARVVEFRDSWGQDTIKGIVFDIEPYGSKRWKDGDRDILMGNYVSGMKNAYSVAKDEGLEVILCIPSWYDQHYNSYFSKLLLYCNEFSVMNYERENEFENMVDELEYARKLDKKITCIFEFQPVGSHDLTEQQTYNIDGIDAAVNSFESLFLKADYPKLKFAYHYLEPLSEMVLGWQ